MKASSNLGLNGFFTLARYNLPRLGMKNEVLLNLHSFSTTFPFSMRTIVRLSSVNIVHGSTVQINKLNPCTRSCLNNSFIVARDVKYGNKQIISVTPSLYEYILANVREPEILRQLREETALIRGSQMQVSPDQAQLLATLVQIMGAERCIEVGVYTGYSSLAVALVLPESGRLVACERDARALEIAKRYYEHAGVLHKVDVRHGLAADELRSLIRNGETCSFDFAFIDADKRKNEEYFELLLQLVRVGGVIVVDNVLWHGKVADRTVDDAKTASIRNFNKKLLADERVSTSMVGSCENSQRLYPLETELQSAEKDN